MAACNMGSVQKQNSGAVHIIMFRKTAAPRKYIVVLQVLICGQSQLHFSNDGADTVAAEQPESRIFHSGVGYIMR